MVFSSVIAFGLSFLDVISVIILGVTASLLARNIQGQGPGDRTSQILDFLGMADANLSTQVMFLGLISLFFLIFKSASIFFITKRIFLFMANQSNLISSRIIENILSMQINKVYLRSSQEHIYIINRGTSHLTMGVLGNSFNLLADTVLLGALIVTLLIADIQTGSLTLIVTVVTIAFLYQLTSAKSKKLSKEAEELGVENNQLVVEFIGSLREIITRNTGAVYKQNIFKAKNSAARIAAELKLLPMYSRSLIEISILTVFLLVALIQFSLSEPSRAVAHLALYLAASSRIAPAMIRIQQGLVSIGNSIGASITTLNLLTDDVPKHNKSNLIENKSTSKVLVPRVTFENVNFRYADHKKWNLQDATLSIEPNSYVGIVGPSGAGKSTLIDLLFGLLEPTSGKILIGGLPPRDAVSVWSSQFGYVPQKPFLAKTTILNNILLGLEPNTDNIIKAEKALDKVGLSEFVSSLEGGLNHLLEEGGSNLSGGQKQKLGIARALVSNPKVLVLDESTSSLDAKSEHSISQTLQELKKHLTLIVVAHRLSLVREADQLFYLEGGRIVSTGTFNELKLDNKEFKRQAEVLGL